MYPSTDRVPIWTRGRERSRRDGRVRRCPNFFVSTFPGPSKAENDQNRTRRPISPETIKTPGMRAAHLLYFFELDAVC
eukprot:3471275-Rhodomonas_salina.1